jgi:Dimethlysulfonioproprionate lyase
MTDPASFLNAPLGQPGSGRVRYGAAMALWRDGLISAEVLEVYRVASAHDGRDPVAILHERGLPVPVVPAPEGVLSRLYTAARDYLLVLDHPGRAEVQASLPVDPGPVRDVPVCTNPVVTEWLEPALQGVAKYQPALAEAIAKAAGALEWITYDAYPREEIGESFAKGHAFASIRGESAPFAAADCDLGLFLIAPHVLYRDHRHAAPELYAPLTGPHGWRFGVGRPLIVQPAHQPVWNPPMRPHMTKVGPVPFLCLFVWTRDVGEVATVLPADDWATLEGLRLG